MHVEPPCEQGVASTDRTWGASSGGAWSLRRFALTLRSSSSGVWLIPTIDIAGKVLASQLPCVVQCRALAGDLGERSASATASVFVAVLGHNQPPPRPLRDRRDRCRLRGLNLPMEAGHADRRQAEGRLKLSGFAKQTRSGFGLLSLSQHPGQARRRTSPAGRPSRALRGTPKRAPNLQLFSRRFAQWPLWSRTVSAVSGQARRWWAITEATPSVGVLQWTRHVFILSLLMPRDFCHDHS